MLDAETWILGSEAGQYGLNCSVIEVESDTRYAARVDVSKYGWFNTPKDIMQIEEEKKPDPVEVTEEVEKEETPVEAPVEEEKPEEETPEEDPRDARIAELEKLVEDLKAQLDECTKKPEEDSVPRAEVDKRVSGMQSKMQAQVNDFKNQLVAKEEELNTVKAELTSLTSKLSETEKELRTTASALEEKTSALATLNADVNASPVASKPSGWGDLTGKAFKNYLKANNNILKITNK
jgi:chromosome segregation ATPase